MRKENIILRATRCPEECIGTVRLTPEAEKVIRRLRNRLNMPIRQIVSEIIIQADQMNLIIVDLIDDD